MEKVKLVISEEKLKDFPSFKNLKLNLNSKKPRKGKNFYKKQLSQIRRVLR